MTENQTVRIGSDAALVLENPAFRLAMDQVKSEVVERWKDCSVRDKEGQLLLLQLAKLTDHEIPCTPPSRCRYKSFGLTSNRKL